MTIVEPILTFFFYAIVAIAAQNAIFTRALGVSRLVKIVDDGSVELFKFGALLTAVQLISSLLSFFAGRALMGLALPYKAAFLPLVLVLCSAIAFFIVLLVLVLPKKRALAKDYLALLPMATFNCSILGTLLLTSTGGYTLLQSMGFSLGSALGYVLAVVLVNEGQRKIQNRGVPATFRGLPITLLYIGVLALAIYGFSGHTPAI
jgi:Na+-translocating ferredoxin:NAD+ oxidoreductase RnfA subunit